MRSLDPSTLRSVTREEMKLLDTLSIESFGIAGAALMETAGQAVAEETERLLKEKGGRVVLIACGTGNNGGDGLVAARHLHNWGYDVRIFLVGKGGKTMADSDAGSNLKAVEKMGLTVNTVQLPAHVDRHLKPAMAEADVVVDAIFGTGMTAMGGQVREPAFTAIEAMNASGKPILAVDLPSGLDCNTGERIGTAVRAAVTVTMALPKTGFGLKDGPDCVGRLVVAELGYPRVLLEKPEGLYLYQKMKGQKKPAAEPPAP